MVMPIGGSGVGPGGERETQMHTQVITFGLNGITEEQYHAACEAEAPMFASIPGLLTKVWLRDPKTDTYGGIYIWADQESYENYVKGEIFTALKGDTSLKNFESRNFGVFDDLSKVTMKNLQAV